MEIDDRRDHSLRIPRPDLTVTLGTPNACNDCHTKENETPEWATEAVRLWYGDKQPAEPHYAQAIAAARNGDPQGLELIRQLLRRSTTPDIIRATAIELLAGYMSPETDRLIREALEDRSPLVRAAAISVLSPQALAQHSFEVASLLNDPVRIVRMAAARRLADDVPRLVDPSLRDAFDAAIEEYRLAQQMSFDRAGAHVQVAAVSQAMGNSKAAIESLRTAIRLEPYLSGIRDTLAQLMEQSGGDPVAIRELRSQEIELLERDSELLEGNPQPVYRRGMLLYLLERPEEARQAFEEACRLAPNSYDNWLALALICEKQQRWDQTVEALRELQKISPNDPAIADIYQRMQLAQQAVENEEKVQKEE